jgi:hypothetical protein
VPTWYDLDVMVANKNFCKYVKQIRSIFIINEGIIIIIIIIIINHDDSDLFTLHHALNLCHTTIILVFRAATFTALQRCVYSS